LTLLKRLDFSTFIGIGIAVAGILVGLKYEGLDLLDLAQPTAALIVFAGTAGAVLIGAPGAQIRQAFRGLKSALFDNLPDPTQLIDQFLFWSRIARSRGMVALENAAEEIGDPVLRKAMRLAVDAVGEERIKSVMELEVHGIETEAESAAQFFETAAGYAPTLGIVGASIGLIHVMKHLEHIEQVGSGIAAAFVATIYGVLFANLVLFPIATRIRTRSLLRVRTCRIISQGVISIANGLNPALLRLDIETALQIQQPQEEDARPAGLAKAVTGKG
jgi:chemotaxis protein MotA